LPPQDRHKNQGDFNAVSISDIAIYLYDHREFLFSSIKLIGTVITIADAYRRLTESKSKGQAPASMEVHLNYNDVKAELRLKGKFTDKQIEKCFEHFKEITSGDTLKNDFTNPDYHKQPNPYNGGAISKDDNTKYEFNPKTGLWQARDFAAEKRELDKQLRDLQRKGLF
jgi:hypothetical protein